MKEQTQKTSFSLGLAVLAAAFIISTLWVAKLVLKDSRAVTKGNKKVIRLVHHMAEKNIQQAFRGLADRYEQLHPDVDIRIQAIPRGDPYLQWVTTQAIGGTAPDLIQAVNKWDQMWSSLAVRYMVPLTEYVGTVNPYNNGTELENTSWRQTYLDNMRAGYWDHLTEYYTIPLTVETWRIFYNKDLFRKATGSDKPPENFHDWMMICEKIKSYAAEKNLKLFPIAAFERCLRDYIWTPYYNAMTDGMSDKYETSYWAMGNPMFTLYGLYTGSFTFEQKQIEAPFKMAKQIAANCQPGYSATSTAQARFLFTQGKAAMVLGNVRDAKILADAAEFEMGVFDYPLPSDDHPEFGGYAAARSSETETPVTHFFLSQTSKYPDVAVDFMMFCTSVEQNQRFNAKLQWYPAIRGARPSEFVKVFKPHIEGASRRILPVTHPNLKQLHLWTQQQFPLYLNGEKSYNQFITELENIWLTKGAEDYLSVIQKYQRSLIQAERNIAKSQAKMLFAEAGEVKAGKVMGNRTTYQIAMESSQLLEHGIAASLYVWHHLQQGNYEFP